MNKSIGPKTTARSQSPLEILAIRPRSDFEDFLLLLTAFSILYKRPGTPPQVFAALVADAERPKGIPTSEDLFAEHLCRALRTQGKGRRFVSLRRARSWLIARNREVGLPRRREQGQKGGRPALGATENSGSALSEAVVLGAIRALAEVPMDVIVNKSRLVAAAAKRIAVGYAYSTLSKPEQKNRRDYVRKLLTQNGWFDEPPGK
jgi:hypothetical protein